MREFFAEQAPRVALVIERRPAMAIHAAPAPGSIKVVQAESAARLIAASAIADRRSRPQRRDDPGCHLVYAAPAGRSPRSIGARAVHATGSAEAMRPALDALMRNATTLRLPAASSSSSRIFLKPRFRPGLGSSALAPLGRDAGRRAGSESGRRRSAGRWQRPAAEPLADPETGDVDVVWFSRRAARERAAANESRIAEPARSLPSTRLRSGADRHGRPREIATGIDRWAERRRRAWRMHSETRPLRRRCISAARLSTAVPAVAADGVVVRRRSAPREAVGLGEPFVYSVEVRGPSGMTVFASAASFVAAAPPRRSGRRRRQALRIEARLLCLDGCAPGGPGRGWSPYRTWAS